MVKAIIVQGQDAEIIWDHRLEQHRLPGTDLSVVNEPSVAPRVQPARNRVLNWKERTHWHAASSMQEPTWMLPGTLGIQAFHSLRWWVMSDFHLCIGVHVPVAITKLGEFFQALVAISQSWLLQACIKFERWGCCYSTVADSSFHADQSVAVELLWEEECLRKFPYLQKDQNLCMFWYFNLLKPFSEVSLTDKSDQDSYGSCSSVRSSSFAPKVQQFSQPSTRRLPTSRMF